MDRFWEWLGRVVFLVLSGMITLSIIGAIAAIPSQSIETRLRVGAGDTPTEWSRATPPRPPAPVPSPRPEPEPLPAPPQSAPSEPTPAPQADVPGTPTTIAPAPRPQPTAADWLESITYALLAIAGLLALGLLLLFRALGHWRRSADALERLAKRP